MKRFFALALAFVLFVGGGFTLSQAQSPQVRQIILTKQQPAASVAPAGSAWGDHGTFITLSTTTIPNDTFTSNNNGGFASVRGTRAYSSGKHYFEYKLLTAPAASAFHVGLADNATATGADMDTQSIINSCGNYGNNGNGVTDGTGFTSTNLGAGLTIANNDIMGVAFDADNGFHYLAQNNTYFLSGDPTSGAMGTGNVCAYTVSRSYYPWSTLWQLVNGVIQIVTASGSLTYAPPVGYSAWNYLLKRDVFRGSNDNTPMGMDRAA